MKNLILTVILCSLSSLQTLAQKAERQLVLPDTATEIQIDSVEFTNIPTKTEVQPIPGCFFENEGSAGCEQTVVVESKEAIAVNLSYTDSIFFTDMIPTNWRTVYFNVNDFSKEDVELLKSVYPKWRHPFTKVNLKFASQKIEFKTEKIKQTIKVVDTKKSKYCSVDFESGEKIFPDCQDQIVYKNSWVQRTLVRISVK